MSTADSGSSSTTTRAPRDERARERDALALAAGEVDAALADQRVVAVRAARRANVVDAGRLARGEHLVPVGVLAAGGEVLAQRHREEHRPLRDERDRAAQLRDRHVARVDAADEHAAAGRVVEARQQVEQRRLARRRSARRRRRSRPARREVEVVQHVDLAAVREAAPPRSGRRAARPAACRGDAGSGSGSIPSSQAKLRPADASARWARFVIQPSASSGQTSWSSSVSKRTNWPIVRWPPITCVPPKKTTAAIESDGQVVEPRQVPRLDAGLAQHGVAHRLGLAAEALAHVVLAAERLHHLDPDDRLVGRLGHVALPLLHLARDRRDAAREAQREHGDRRHRDRRVEREPRVDEHEHDRRADDHHQALDRPARAPSR